ncbi:MAG: hypothetical protein VSS75_029055 [Candidatus Parabeggiatoa sp.]|nr:hypothetical protein [Candidatus Parabeggiatoa sp.]
MLRVSNKPVFDLVIVETRCFASLINRYLTAKGARDCPLIASIKIPENLGFSTLTKSKANTS